MRHAAPLASPGLGERREGRARHRCARFGRSGCSRVLARVLAHPKSVTNGPATRPDRTVQIVLSVTKAAVSPSTNRNESSSSMPIWKATPGSTAAWWKREAMPSCQTRVRGRMLPSSNARTSRLPSPRAVTDNPLGSIEIDARASRWPLAVRGRSRTVSLSTAVGLAKVAFRSDK